MVEGEVRGVTLNDVKFTVHHRHFWDEFERHVWEPQTIITLDRFLKPEKDLLDLGAWIGPVTLYASRKCRRVIAVEPDPAAFLELMENCALSADPEKENVALLNATVGPFQGWANLSNPQRFGNSQSSIQFNDLSLQFGVFMCTFNDIARLGVLDDLCLIKMDIEGAEAPVLPTMVPWLRERKEKPALFVSFHPTRWGGDVETTASLVHVLCLYKHLYNNLGVALSPTDVMGLLISQQNADVVATDEEW